jgi:hypothetical protein
MFPPVITAPLSDNFISIFIPVLKGGFQICDGTVRGLRILTIGDDPHCVPVRVVNFYDVLRNLVNSHNVGPRRGSLHLSEQ